MTNPGDSKTVSNLPIAVDPLAAQILIRCFGLPASRRCGTKSLEWGRRSPAPPFSAIHAPGLASALTVIIWVPAAWTSGRGEQSTRLADVWRFSKKGFSIAPGVFRE